MGNSEQKGPRGVNEANVVLVTILAASVELVSLKMRRVSKLSVAPMMDWTDPHFRHFMRLVSKRTLLYTEMHVVDALQHMDIGKVRRSLGSRERNMLHTALQVGGSEPDIAGSALRRVWEDGYHFQEVNINCGCPSQKVSGAGLFGAVLMDDPERVSALARSIHAATPSSGQTDDVHITVKCRIGVARPSEFEACNAGDSTTRHTSSAHERDGTAAMLQYFRGRGCAAFKQQRETERFEKLCHFVRTVSETSPVNHFVVHAREAVR